MVEIRFEPQAPFDAVFGTVYTAMSPSYKDAKELPVVQIPEKVRNSHPHFMYQPCNSLSKEIFSLQVGPRVLIFGVENYPGWDVFSSEVLAGIFTLKEKQLFKEFTRVGIRYIDFFQDTNVFSISQLKIGLKNCDVGEEQSFVRVRTVEDGFDCLLQGGNDLRVKAGQTEKTGSIIDLDVSLSGDELKEADFNFENRLNEAHAVCKRVFFGLLEPSFLETRKAEY